MALTSLLGWLFVAGLGCGEKRSEGRQPERPVPYVRCNAAVPPPARSGVTGGARFEVRGRTLVLSRGAEPVRVAVFSGSGVTGTDVSDAGGTRAGLPATALRALRETHAEVFVLVGGLGRTPEQAGATLRALAGLERLVLVILGGADVDVFAAGTQGYSLDERVLNAAALRRVRIGRDSLVPWAGSEHGRYTVSDDACGFDGSDVAAAWDELGPAEAGERRWLFSWQAPSAGQALAERLAGGSLRGVLSAWPPPTGLPKDWDVSHAGVVPRAWGPRIERPDGTRMAHGVLVLRFDPDGPHIVR